MARKTDMAWRIITATLELAETRPWRRISLSEIAAAADVSLNEVHKHFSSKAAILRGFSARIDTEVLAALEKDSDPDVDLDGPRDRLFDVIMHRFDALNPHKDAMRRLARTAPGDPAAMICAVPTYLNSMGWMLEAAGVSASGVRGALRVRGLAAIYLSVLRVWFNDDSEDMAATMAALDKALARAERVLTVFSRGFDLTGRRERDTSGEAEAAPSEG